MKLAFFLTTNRHKQQDKGFLRNPNRPTASDWGKANYA
jgi:hypothetical protein